MALVRCKECRAKISSKATACPRCGYRAPVRKGGCGWFSLIAVVLLIVMVFRYSTVQNTPERNANSSKPDTLKEKAGGVLSAEIIQVRTKPFITAQGNETTMLYVDWKNTGTRPIRIVDAKILLFDEFENEIGRIPGNHWCIYAETDLSEGVAPGKSYIEPDGEGYIIEPDLSKRVRRVKVEIMNVEEKGLK